VAWCTAIAWQSIGNFRRRPETLEDFGLLALTGVDQVEFVK
jgi:hypothetical protein